LCANYYYLRCSHLPLELCRAGTDCRNKVAPQGPRSEQRTLPVPVRIMLDKRISPLGCKAYAWSRAVGSPAASAWRWIAPRWQHRSDGWVLLKALAVEIRILRIAHVCDYQGQRGHLRLPYFLFVRRERTSISARVDVPTALYSFLRGLRLEGQDITDSSARIFAVPSCFSARCNDGHSTGITPSYFVASGTRRVLAEFITKLREHDRSYRA